MKFIYIPTKRMVYSLELWKRTCIYLSCNMFFTWYKCILTVITQCTGRQLCSEWFLLFRAGMETCTVHVRWLVWRYLLLGPWGCTLVSVWEGRLGGGMNRNSFLCSEMPLGNSGEWRTIYFKGVWLLLVLEKNSTQHSCTYQSAWKKFNL